MASVDPTTQPAGSTNRDTPFGEEKPGLSPEELASAVRVNAASDVRGRIAASNSVAPSVRQQTQSEMINMRMLHSMLGNPFSARRLPFPILRDMLQDPMIAMGLFYTKTPLIRADWSIASPDAQLAAAVDEGLRPIVSWLTIKQCGALGYGYQPMVKMFKLGKLSGVYRDPHSDDPEADKPVWTSKNVEPLLWDVPISLPPENCLPMWDDRGEFAGYRYTVVPIPNPELVGISMSYNTGAVPGYPIPLDWAMWRTNEQEENFGSIFGSPRIKRAHRYWWSYWYRWNLADRSFENKADPPKIVYYPTDATEVLDANDMGQLTPEQQNTRAAALAIGQQARSGATIAMPNGMVKDDNGKVTNQREWEIKYLEGGENFDLLDKSFAQLDLMKWQALFLPGSIFNAGRSQGSSGGGSGTSKNVSTPIEVFDESQQLLADEHDDEINRVLIPQFIAANFPEKVGTPCRKVTRGFGSADTEIVKQLLQLVGQTKGIVLPVDTRQLLREANIPLLTTQQQKTLEEKVAKEAEAMQPPVQNPEKVGMQGYNSGVTKTPLGNVYVSPPQMIALEETHQHFLQALPKITPFEDQSVRASAVRIRKTFMKRYKDQIDTFVTHLKDHTPLMLAQTSPPAEEAKEPGASEQPPSPLFPTVAAATATAIVAAWFAQRTEDKTPNLLGAVVTKIVNRAGERELHLANLDGDSFDKDGTKNWVDRYVEKSMSSIDTTLQAEMVSFLTDELQKTIDPAKIVEAVENHFSTTPETHAERVARATTRDSYNYGMLVAGQDAGVQQVQAHDASDGDNPDTDPRCVERNGRIFPISAALEEEEHPYGTLHWSYLSTDGLSIERVDDFPLNLEVPAGSKAAYDDETETLYIASDATNLEESEYALTIGSKLTIR